MKIITASVSGSSHAHRGHRLPGLSSTDVGTTQRGDAVRNKARQEMITTPGQPEFDLPELCRTDDPRGGAAAWAVLAVSMAVIAGMLLAAMWAAGAW